MPKATDAAFGVIADDFTGACDTAGAFAAHGLEPVVCLQSGQRPLPRANPVVFDADMRDALPEAYLERLRAAIRATRRPGSGLAFLKIDSTLRGDIAGYLHEALKLTHLEGVLLAPAFPEQGRRLIQGKLQWDGVKCEHTPDLLQRFTSASIPAGVLPLELVAAAPEALKAELAKRFGAGLKVLIIDASTPQHLRNLARVWLERRDSWLLAGSAGIARQAAFLLARKQPARSPRAPRRHAGGDDAIVVIAGSPEPATLLQIEELLQSGTAYKLEVDSETTPAVLTSYHRRQVLLMTPKGSSLSGLIARDRGERARAMARACRSWASDFRPRGLVVTGGATARALCEHLEVQTVRINGELAPGVPYGVLGGGPWDGVPIVTKSGGFGGPGQLLEAAKFLKSHTKEAI